MTIQLFDRETRNEIEVKFSTFPGGEEYVRVIGGIGDGDLVIEARLTSSIEVMRYLMLVEALQEIGVPFQTLMPYLPYARQDRTCRPGESFSLMVFARLLTSPVVVADKHSTQLDQIMGLAQWEQHEVFERVYNQFNLAEKEFVFVAPDKGARLKAQRSANVCNRPLAYCEKLRNDAGEVCGVALAGGDVNGKDCLIIDDICDGGRTFLEVAKVLKNAGAKSASLYVTHGIFSAGLPVFRGVLDEIYTTNSFFPRYVQEFVGEEGNLSVKVFDIFNLMWEEL